MSGNGLPKIFPGIKTERLNLREIEIADGGEILFLRSNKAVTKFIERPEERQTKTLEAAVKFIKELQVAFSNQESISWGITLKNNPQIIGTICLWNFSNTNKTAEVGYDLNPFFQGQGLMDEALKRVIDYGFGKLKFETIEAFTHQDNESSKKLLTKNGFTLIKHRKDPDNAFNLIYELKNSKSP